MPLSSAGRKSMALQSRACEPVPSIVLLSYGVHDDVRSVNCPTCMLVFSRPGASFETIAPTGDIAFRFLWRSRKCSGSVRALHCGTPSSHHQRPMPRRRANYGNGGENTEKDSSSET